jgi:hypothetical protein
MIFLGVLAFIIFWVSILLLFFAGLEIFDSEYGDGHWYGLLIPIIGIPAVCQIGYWLFYYMFK